jgi:protein-S-isoprenylcysteine O-methyltransferase Ste14
MLGRTAVAVFAVVVYLVFLGSFLAFVIFSSGLLPSFTVDAEARGSPLAAVALDLCLVFLFGATHSVMARPRWKRLWTRGLGAGLERSVYVLVASIQLLLLCALWWPVAAPDLWRSSGALAIALQALAAVGWATALGSSYLIDHLALFGLRQGLGLAPVPDALRTPFLYRIVRHPMYLGMVIGLWAAPRMTFSHALFAGLFTLYVLIGIRYEERALIRSFGKPYCDYQARVPMLLPLPRRTPAVTDAVAARHARD